MRLQLSVPFANNSRFKQTNDWFHATDCFIHHNIVGWIWVFLLKMSSTKLEITCWLGGVVLVNVHLVRHTKPFSIKAAYAADAHTCPGAFESLISDGFFGIYMQEKYCNSMQWPQCSCVFLWQVDWQMFHTSGVSGKNRRWNTFHTSIYIFKFWEHFNSPAPHRFDEKRISLVLMKKCLCHIKITKKHPSVFRLKR